MQSTNIRKIKQALWNQAFLGNTFVFCPFGQVVAVRRRKGLLLAMIRGWDRWNWPKQARPCLLRPNELADLLGPLLFSGWSMGGSFRLTASFLRKQKARLLRDPLQERVPEKNYP
jgi:hypothetical protein